MSGPKPIEVTGWLPNLIGPIDVLEDGEEVAVPRRQKFNLVGVSIEDEPEFDRTKLTFSGGGNLNLPDGSEDDVIGLDGDDGLKNLGPAAEVPDGDEDDVVGLDGSGGLKNLGPMTGGDGYSGTIFVESDGPFTLDPANAAQVVIKNYETVVGISGGVDARRLIVHARNGALFEDYSDAGEARILLTQGPLTALPGQSYLFSFVPEDPGESEAPAGYWTIVGGSTPPTVPSDPPELSSVNTDVTNLHGGGVHTFTGTNLLGATATYGGSACTVLSSTSTEIVVQLPAKTAGAHDFVASNGSGDSSPLSIEAWHPELLSCSLLLQPDYNGGVTPSGGSTWAGKASAGSSSGRDAVGPATHEPAIGTAVNGKYPADFKDTAANERLTIAATVSQLYGSGSYWGVMLVKIRAIETDSATKGANEPLFITPGSLRCQVYLRSGSGGTINLFHLDNTGADSAVAQCPATVGSYKLVHWKYDGTNLRIGAAGTWGTAVAANPMHASNSSFSFGIGQSGLANAWTNADILEVGTGAAGVLSDADITKWRKYAMAEYPSLGAL